MKKMQNKNICSSVRRPTYTTGAFTLIELIVVITILAILWTIAFISLQWYSAQARDSKRVSDVSNIKKSLELFSLNTWKYPLPDNPIEYSFSWDLLWGQWTIWDQVFLNLSKNLNEKPLDPLKETEYIYSISNSQTQYEVLVNYETSNLVRSNLFNNIFAVEYLPKINWNYNWIYVKSVNFIFPTPSIINALNIETDFATNSDAIQSQIITGWENNIDWWTWTLSDLTMTYTWIIDDNSSDTAKISVIDILQSFYSWTSLSSIEEIENLLSKSTDEDKKNLADFIILNSWVVNTSNTLLLWTSSSNPGLSCVDILNNRDDIIWNNSEDSWLYWVQSGSNSVEEIFCDMSIDWGGWELALNIDTSDGNLVHYENTDFWESNIEWFWNIWNHFTSDYKNINIFNNYLWTQLMIQVHEEWVLKWWKSYNLNWTTNSLYSRFNLWTNIQLTSWIINSNISEINTNEPIIKQNSNLYLNTTRGSSNNDSDRISIWWTIVDNYWWWLWTYYDTNWEWYLRPRSDAQLLNCYWAATVWCRIWSDYDIDYANSSRNAQSSLNYDYSIFIK